MESLPLSEVYKLLEPGPVVLLATARDGRRNVMTMSWHMMVEFAPPLVACVVSDRNHSATALQATGECVIAIPDRRLADVVVGIGNCSGRSVDKFEAFGLNALPAKTVGAPLIAECFANLECSVVNTSLTESYGLRVLEVRKAWRDPGQSDPCTLHHAGYGRFVADGETFRVPSAMP